MGYKYEFQPQASAWQTQRACRMAQPDSTARSQRIVWTDAILRQRAAQMLLLAAN